MSRTAPASRAAPGERRRRVVAILIPLFAMILGGAAIAGGAFALHRFVTRSPHFALREIRTSGLQHLRPDEVAARTGVRPGDNLFSFSLDAVARRLRGEPWIASVRLHRELPSALAVEVEERKAAAVVELGSLYLADARGEVFKRATLDEAAAFPVVTGVARDAYVHDREGAQALIREGIAALGCWRSQPGRAPIGEVHVDIAAGTTLYARDGGTAIHAGRGGEELLRARMERVDAVWSQLVAGGERPQVIHADAPTHPERVTVRLAAAPRANP